MKKIVIAGSCSLKEKIKFWFNYFKKRGYEVIASPTLTAGSLSIVYKEFYEKINEADELFIMNEDKDGKEGYIGPSTFAELLYAVMQNQLSNKNIKVTIFKIPHTDSENYNVVNTFLSHNWISLFKFDLLPELEYYKPFNEQEEKDKELFLYYTNLYSKISSHPIEYLLVRSNLLAHFSSSAFVVNKDKTKVLVVYHKILDGWVYPGGHSDGCENLLSVAIREVNEETGINPKVLDNNIFGIQAAPTPSHIKNGKYVSSHIHFDVIYLLEGDDTEELSFRTDESKGVKWIPIENVVSETLPSFKSIFEKLIKKLFNNK